MLVLSDLALDLVRGLGQLRYAFRLGKIRKPVGESPDFPDVGPVHFEQEMVCL